MPRHASELRRYWPQPRLLLRVSAARRLDRTRRCVSLRRGCDGCSLYNPGCPYRRRPIDTGGDSTHWFAVSPTLLRQALATYDRRAAEASVRLFQFGFVRSDASLYLAQRRIFRAVTARAVDDVLAVEIARSKSR